MEKKFFKWLSLVLLVLLAACGQTKEEETVTFKNEVTQTINSGQVKGNQDKENGVLEWLGIPYAAAPIGYLRWKEPQSVDDWIGTFDASKAGEKFVQFTNGEVVGSEGALNLDVVRPDTTEAGLPVIVFLHGGNNQTGHAQEIKGNTFVKDVNAVYVSVNYRLGVLGFNPLEALNSETDLEKSGNFTLLDIAVALDWVQANIEVFGGDKNNVTLAGFSAGGRDVMATLISPHFQGKYHKAISFSGGMTLADKAESQDIFATALAPLVVEDGLKADEAAAKEWLLTSDQEVEDYLYSLSADRLTPSWAMPASACQSSPTFTRMAKLYLKKVLTPRTTMMFPCSLSQEPANFPSLQPLTNALRRLSAMAVSSRTKTCSRSLPTQRPMAASSIACPTQLKVPES